MIVPSSACNGVAIASRVSVTPSDRRSRTRPRLSTPDEIACTGGTNASSTTKTNQNQSPVNNLLNNFLKPK